MSRYEPDCPGPDCPMCNGAMCGLCGAGCWSSVRNCTHASDERHREPAVDKVHAWNDEEDASMQPDEDHNECAMCDSIEGRLGIEHDNSAPGPNEAAFLAAARIRELEADLERLRHLEQYQVLVDAATAERDHWQAEAGRARRVADDMTADRDAWRSVARTNEAEVERLCAARNHDVSLLGKQIEKLRAALVIARQNQRPARRKAKP